MNASEKTGIGRNYLSWLTFVGLAVFLPAMIGWFACEYIGAVFAEARLRKYQIEATDVLERLRVSADSGQYVCERLNGIFGKSASPEELEQNAVLLNKELDGALNFLVWDKHGEVATATFAWQEKGVDWKQAFLSLFSISSQHQKKSSPEEIANLRRIFGPQFFPELHSNCYSGRNIKPMYGDSSTVGPLSWMRTGKKFGLAVFFANKFLNELPGLDYQIRDTSRRSDLKLAVLAHQKLLSDPAVKFSKEEFALISESFANPQRIADWYVFKSLLKTDIHGFCFLPVNKVEGMQWNTAWKVLLMLLLLTGILLVVRSYQVFCGGQSINLSIRRQLVLLFFVSNALSLSILGLLGFDYLQQYGLFLQTEAFSKGMTYLQSIDEMFVSELSNQLRRMNKSLAQLSKDLQAGPPDRAAVERFLKSQSPKPFRMFLIGSHTPIIASELGIMKDGKFIEEINMDYVRYKSMRTLVDSMGKLGNYYLSLLNREALSEAIVTQVELIAESLGQLRPIEMYQEFFAATGSFWQWGMGARYYPAFINVLRIFDPEKIDYVFLYLWNSNFLHHEYIRKIIPDLNRNPLGIKIMAVDEDFIYSYPAELLEHKQLRAYSAKLREKTGTEIDYCNWEDERYLLMGLKCNSISSIRLLGLYPTEDIEARVRQKLYLFIAFALVSFLVSVALGLFVARSILQPLKELQSGVMALKKRDFAYRLPELGADEFGELARIFNTTLIDLEELHVASVVQEKLVEKMQQEHREGSLRIYGCSHSLLRLGGDYFEFSKIDETHSGFFMGDVAGQGVAVSLVMAFVKACILQLKPMHCQPAALLGRLYDLVSETNDREHRKFMTMQYALTDSATGEIVLANAGHCFPIIINQAAGSVKTVELPSIPLGAGKKARINTASITLSAGEALVLYSGGLYRNGDIGFERLGEILLSSFSSCPVQYHDNVMKSIFAIVPQSECVDDLSLLIIVADQAEIALPGLA